tara:strand:+ start:252 stop:665 length:414 start_codon:yes stop_codon:yes gene_type:complete
MKFDQRSVDVGFFKRERYGPDNDNMYVSEVAWMNDQGTSQVPPRPFMTVDFQQYASKNFKKRAKNLFYLLLYKKNVPFLKELNKIGDDFSNELKTIIYDYPGSNSDWWADAKGFNDPLYHTGVMVNAVDYRIVRGSD